MKQDNNGNNNQQVGSRPTSQPRTSNKKSGLLPEKQKISMLTQKRAWSKRRGDRCWQVAEDGAKEMRDALGENQEEADEPIGIPT